MSNADDRLFSKANEAAVLGSMIIDPACIEKVLTFVSVEDFALVEHRIIFQTVLDLRSKGEAVDGLLTRSALDQSGQLEKVGGVEYLGKILESVPSSANAEFYAKIVKEKSKLRRLVDVGEKISKLIDSADSAGEGVFQIQQIVAGLDGALESCGGSQAIIKSLADVQPSPIQWFWFNRIPMGMLTLIQGDPGLGKSFLTLDMAARVSTGGTWPGNGVPDNRAPRGSVVLLTAEDHLSQTVRPRLDAMGADTSKIIALQGMRRKDEENRQYVDSFNLKTDLEALEQAVRSKNDTKLVIIDPLSAYLGGKVDAYRDTDVRGVLMPLVQFAEKNNVAVIGVRHLNKSGTGKAIYRGLDSIAFTAAARTVWLLSTDPGDPDSKRRLLTAAKHNLLIEPTGLAFELDGGRVIFEDEPVTLTSDEALGQTSTVEAVVKDEAVLWLRDTLTPGKSLASIELDKLAETQGIKSSTLRRAKKEAGVTSYRLQVGDKTQWFCRIGE